MTDTEQVTERSKQIEEVISLIENGMAEREACRTVGIPRSTFRTTALRHQMGDQYARALFGLAEDQIQQIEIVLEKLENGEIDPQTARVLADTRKWFASKFLPKRYGDRIQHANDPENPMPAAVTVPPELTDKFGEWLTQSTKQ